MDYFRRFTFLLCAPAFDADELECERLRQIVVAVEKSGFEVVRAYPHDPAAFTQGLVFRNGELLESTGRYPSTVRRVRLEDGVVLQQRELDGEYFGEGLTAVGDRVLTLTWKGGKGFIWDPATLEPEGEFAYAGEGWGLTHDATSLIMRGSKIFDAFGNSQTLPAIVLDGGGAFDSTSSSDPHADNRTFAGSITGTGGFSTWGNNRMRYDFNTANNLGLGTNTEIIV